VTALIFDTSPLSHFARAGELATLDELTRRYDRYVTQAVRDEIDRARALHPRLGDVTNASWLVVVRVDGLAELSAFADFARVLGSGVRDVGEAATLAWAQVHALSQSSTSAQERDADVNEASRSMERFGSSQRAVAASYSRMRAAKSSSMD
jgi:hypothetical protein